MHRLLDVRSHFLLALLAITVAPLSAEAVITSTGAGGLWTSPSTWVGGVVPGALDDVIIVGPVSVPGTQSCASLSVTAAGLIQAAPGGPVTLDVGGAVDNQGAIVSEFVLSMIVGGDLTNGGTWVTRPTTLDGVGDQRVAVENGSMFDSDLVRGVAAGGDIIVDSALTLMGSVDTGTGRMVLLGDAPLTLMQGAFSGELAANGNELHFVSWSYLTHCVIDNAVLVGPVRVGALVFFTGVVTVMDSMTNLPSGGSSHLRISGTFINHGVIENDTYGLTIELSGDLENHGVIRCSHLSFDGSTDHHVRMGPTGETVSTVLLPEFGAGTIVGETDLQFSGGISLGAGGTMTLPPGSTLTLSGSGSVGGGTLLANGSRIHMNGTGVISSIVVDQAVLTGQVQVAYTTTFTGGLTVEGILQNREFAPAEMTVDGAFINNGTVRDNVHPLTIVALGDVDNRGTWSNKRLELGGDTDQTTRVGPGIDVPEFVLDSKLQGASFEWLADGVPIDGEIDPTLVFDTVRAADTGSYVCVSDGAQVSRTFVVEEGEVTGIALQVVPSVTVFERARPNPFRHATDVGFVLDASASVELAAYDVAGRRVAIIVERTLRAGRHVVTWEPNGLVPGVYFLRLRASGREIVQKATLVP